MHRFSRSFLSAALLLSVLLAGAPAARAQTDVLVRGQPPLTQQMVNGVNDFFEWLLDAPMTAMQRQQMQESLVDSWQRGDRDDMQTVADVMQLRQDLAKLAEGERAFVRLQLQQAILPTLRQQPEDPMARLLVGLYDGAHTPIAPGTPPLTRQMSDAHIEVLSFQLNQVAGTEAFAVTQELQDEWAALLAATYASLTPDQQAQLAQLPLYAAALRAAWSTLPDANKAQLRAQWNAQLAELRPATPGQMPGLPPAPPPSSECTMASFLCEAIDASVTQREREAPVREAVDRMSCEELLTLSDDVRAILSASQLTRIYGCVVDKERQEDAKYPPAEQARRRLARNQANYAFASNVSSMQHAANMSAISNIGDNGWKYEYRPVG